MRRQSRLWAVIAGLLMACPPLVRAAAEPRPLTVAGQAYSAEFSSENGSLVRFATQGKTESLWQSGEDGLWQLTFQDDRRLTAAQFSADSRERSFRQQWDPAGRILRMTYRAADIEVLVTATGADQHLDLQAQVRTPKTAVLEFALPARLRFDPRQLVRLVCPADGNQAVGMAFRGTFFQPQDEASPSGWTTKAAGPQGYHLLYGGPLVYRPDGEPPIALRVTDQGRAWLGPDQAARLSAATATVNRPPQVGQADLVLIDSGHGPYLSASHLGGEGWLWRIGGAVRGTETQTALAAVGATIAHLVKAAAPSRTKVGLLALPQGPAVGNWSDVSVADWRQRLAQSIAAGGRPVELVDLTSPAAMLRAAAGNDFLAILNPYGEGLPTRPRDSLEVPVQAIGKYVRAGGNWFEVGGHPFHSRLVPVQFYQYACSYPPAFADFLHSESSAGLAAVYRVQPRTWEPWQGKTDPNARFVPGRLACGGDERGGWCERPFGTYIAPGATWQSPPVRLVAGQTAADGLRAYCEANAITRRLEDKLPADLVDRFKNSVLVYYAGNCQEKLAHLAELPVPTQVHFADYLRGGFDKQYPDHLPPAAAFGTPEQFRELFDRGRQLGHLLIPYTNPTWWCDGPPGPTFAEQGDAPLLKRLDGQRVHEQYGQNEGYTVCHWHPAVQAANRRTVDQFSRDYPCDVLFQDQCGARGWQYDSNPASPSAAAYTEGLLSMVAEDCRRKPLATESGWDGVVNFESQLCGMTWSLVPTEGGPAWRQLLKTRYAPATWEIFPVAQYIAHDKAAMLHHDLGQFVTNRETLAWTLGLGFSLSYRVQATALGSDSSRQWLLWLDRLQKSVCAHYVGQPLTEFAHDRDPAAPLDDDGTLRARYGTVQVVANLSPRPLPLQQVQLAPWGFAATAPDVVAANLQMLGGQEFAGDGVSFVAQGDNRQADVWVYARPDERVAVLAPAALPAGTTLFLDGKTPLATTGSERIWQFTLPPRAGTQRVSPPPELAAHAPCDWPRKPAIGVLDLPGVTPVWTKVGAGDWLRALEQSGLVRRCGLPVRRVTSAEELGALLRAGPTDCWAVINPYGEIFPTTGRGQWRAMLDAIRDYVNRGGCWWETAGYSFHQAAWREENGWQFESVGPAGMAQLRLPLEGGEVEQPAELLQVTAAGRAWLDPQLAARVATAASPVNRGLARGQQDPGHVTLVAGREIDWLGGYRLDGWGWLWRIGGFWPNPDVAVPVTLAALEHLATHLPEPVPPGGPRYVWSGTLRGPE